MRIVNDVEPFKMVFHEGCVGEPCHCPLCEVERDIVWTEVANIEDKKKERERNS